MRRGILVTWRATTGGTTTSTTTGKSSAPLPPSCGHVLDVGCGEGMLARELSRKAARVTGMDRDEATLELAYRDAAAANIDYVLGDLLTYPFAAGSFDAVVWIATIHHIGTTTALERMRELVRPGGTIAVIGLARSARPRRPGVRRCRLVRDAVSLAHQGTLGDVGAEGVAAAGGIPRDQAHRDLGAARRALPPPRLVPVLARVDEACVACRPWPRIQRTRSSLRRVASPRHDHRCGRSSRVHG